VLGVATPWFVDEVIAAFLALIPLLALGKTMFDAPLAFAPIACNHHCFSR